MKKNEFFHTEELDKQKRNMVTRGSNKAQTCAKLLPGPNCLQQSENYIVSKNVIIIYVIFIFFYLDKIMRFLS